MKIENIYQALPDEMYHKQSAKIAKDPKIVLFNQALADEIGWEVQQDAQKVLCANKVPNGTTTLALAYAGHQYGRYTMLGDGRALYMGSVNNGHKRFDIHCKGTGPTKYSRGGDGMATLSSMLKEYICSESMHALGINTTRSLAVCTTGSEIMRDELQPAAILSRVATSHIRFGTFEYAHNHEQEGLVNELLKFCTTHYYPQLKQRNEQALELVKIIMDKYIMLIVEWLRVGFIHGVMNTDNMSIVAETIDYGPCAFMDTYNPHAVFSYIDRYGRYAFNKQPSIALWNIERFTQSLVGCMSKESKQAVKKLLANFPNEFEKHYHTMLCAKIGLQPTKKHIKLAYELLQWMYDNKADYTNTFCALTYEEVSSTTYNNNAEFKEWVTQWLQCIHATKAQSLSLMREKNPVIIPRNHQVVKVIENAVQGDEKPLKKLLEIIKNPYSYNDINAYYRQPPNEKEKVQVTYCGT